MSSLGLRAGASGGHRCLRGPRRLPAGGRAGGQRARLWNAVVAHNTLRLSRLLTYPTWPTLAPSRPASNVIWPDERSAALDEMVRLLEYGCVSVNCWAALSYSNALGVWGGAPGSYQPAAPMSGLGFVGNAARVPSVQKALARLRRDGGEITATS